MNTIPEFLEYSQPDWVLQHRMAFCAGMLNVSMQTWDILLASRMNSQIFQIRKEITWRVQSRMW